MNNMKKILLILVIFLLLGCKKEENDEIIKYRLTDNKKMVIELKENSNLHYVIDENFYIEYQDNLIGSISFLNKDQCNNIENTKGLDKIKEDEHGFSYKEDNYHYLNNDNEKCVLVNAKELDNLNRILDNILIRIEEVK